MCHSPRRRLKNKGAAAPYTTAVPYSLGDPHQVLSGPRAHLLLPWHGHYRDKLEKPPPGEGITPPSPSLHQGGVGSEGKIPL